MASAEYHRRQAVALIQLAQSTREADTSAALLRLAAGHTALADEAARIKTESKPLSEPSGK